MMAGSGRRLLRSAAVHLGRSRPIRRLVPIQSARRIDRWLFGTNPVPKTTTTSPTHRTYRFLGADHLVDRGIALAHNLRAQALFGSLIGSCTGRTGIILGNGPSLNRVDFDLIRRVTTIGSNHIHLAAEQYRFLPDIVTCTNLLVLEQAADIYRELDECLVVLPVYAQDLIGEADHIVYLNINHDGDWSDDVVDGASTFATVSYFNLQLAGYLGFETIGLVGFDHAYHQPDGGSHGTVIQASDGDDPNHFSPDYFRNRPWQQADTGAMEAVYATAQRRLAPRRVINATDGGQLEIFERRSLARLLETGQGTRCELDRSGALRRLLVSVNPNLRQDDGHYLRIDRALRREANRRDVGFVGLGSRNAVLAVDRDHGWFVPTFTGSFEERHVGDADPEGVLTGFVEEFAAGLALARGTTRHADSDPIPCTVFWYQANLEYLELHGLFDDPEVLHHLHLFFAYRYELGDHHQREHVSRLLGIAANLPNVTVSLGTKALVDYWRSELGVELALFPSAPSLLPTPASDSDTTRSHVFLPAGSSRGKGYGDTIRLIERILDDHSVLAGTPLVIRDETDRLGQRDRAILARARSDPRIKMLDGIVGDEAFAGLYQHAAVVVLPYRSDPFALRSSGSFTDAVALGAPVVVCEGTAFADDVRTHGLGTTYQAGDLDGLIEAIDTVRSGAHHVGPQSARCRIATQQSVPAMLDVLLEGDLGGRMRPSSSRLGR